MKPSKLLFALLFALFTIHAPARLPDAALARAQQAEQMLKQNKPDEAVKTLLDLDRAYPGTPAIHLRLAQIYDTQDKAGEALFHYRRYIQLAGDTALDEAKERLYTLELSAGAKEGADEYAKKLGQESTPVEVPTPGVTVSKEKLNKDGSLSPMKPGDVVPDTVERAMQPGTPSPSAAVSREPIKKLNPADILRPRPEDVQPTGAPVAATAAVPAKRNIKAATPTPAPAEDSPAPTPESAIDAEKRVKEQSHSQRQLLPTPRVKTAFTPPAKAINDIWATAKETPKETRVGSAQASKPAGSVDGAAAQTSSPNPKQTQSSAVPADANSAPASGSSDQGAPLRNQAGVDRTKNLFTTRVTDSKNAVIRISNLYPDSTLTFTAIPVEEGESVKVTIPTGEAREMSTLKPGTYRVSINIIDDSYPPITLFNVSTDVTFVEGMQYSRKFLPAAE